MQQPTKQCNHCQQVKPLEDFYKHPYNRGGYFHRCKTCEIARQSAYQKTPKGKAVKKAAARRYDRSEKGRENHHKRMRRYREEFPEHQKAQSAVRVKIHSGEWLPASEFSCRSCGAKAEHYHHYLGYAREHWLDVIPLCFQCHMAIHRG